MYTSIALSTSRKSVVEIQRCQNIQSQECQNVIRCQMTNSYPAQTAQSNMKANDLYCPNWILTFLRMNVLAPLNFKLKFFQSWRLHFDNLAIECGSLMAKQFNFVEKMHWKQNKRLHFSNWRLRVVFRFFFLAKWV